MDQWKPALALLAGLYQSFLLLHPCHLCLRDCVDEMTACLGSLPSPTPRRLWVWRLLRGDLLLLLFLLLLLLLLLLSVSSRDSCDPKLPLCHLTTTDSGSGKERSKRGEGHQSLPVDFLLTSNISLIPFLTFGILRRLEDLWHSPAYLRPYVKTFSSEAILQENCARRPIMGW